MVERMYVLAVGLAPDRHAKLTAACAAIGLQLDAVSAGEPIDLRDDLLAAYFEFDADGSDGVAPQGVSERGALAVAFASEEFGGDVYLREIRNGYGMVLPASVTEERLVRSLTYLRDVVPPAGSQRLWLNEHRLLASAVGSVQLDLAEDAFLRRLGSTPGSIVSREELAKAGGADVQGVSVRIKERLAEIGSGAQLLKVPHLGFRFVGTLHEGEPSPIR
jgi:hypothetical protein